jgi:hypothetical protein
MPRQDLIQHRRGSAAAWAAANPVLADGEPGFVADTNEIRYGDGVTPWSGLSAVGSEALSLASGGITVESKGAAKDFSGAADDTAFLNATITSAAAFGGTVVLSRLYNVPNGITLSESVKIRGCGGMLTVTAGSEPSAPSGLLVSSATADGLTVTAKGVVLEDFAVINTRALASPPTAGRGIFLNEADHYKLRGVMVYGFYDLLQRQDCWFGEIQSSHFYDPIRYGIYDTVTKGAWVDHADSGVINCIIAFVRRLTNADAAWRHEGGAGMRWIGNKIVGQAQPVSGAVASSAGTWVRGIDIKMADGMDTGGEFSIIGGGTSNCLVACIDVGLKGPVFNAFFGRLVVAGHVLQGFGGANTTVGIIAGGPTGGTNIRNLNISENHFSGLHGGGIHVYSCWGMTVGANSWENMAGFLVKLGGGTDTGGSNTRSINVAPQGLGEKIGAAHTNIDILRDDRNFNDTEDRTSGLIDRRYTTALSLSTVGAWETLYSIRPATTIEYHTAAGRLKLTLSGQEYPGSAFSVEQERGFYVNAAAPAIPTVSTIGTDTTIGAAPNIEVRYNITDSPGWILVQARLVSPGLGIGGEATIDLSGKSSVFAVGTSPLI